MSNNDCLSCNFKREELIPNVHFSAVTDKKFKFDRITVCLIMPMDREKVTVNALIPSLLRRSCESYPDFTALNKKLGELYGAVLDADVGKFGSNQVLNVIIQGIDDRFSLENESLTREYAQLLCDMLFKPDFENGAFKQQAVDIEKKSLKDLIESEINEKRTYAISQCIQSMFADSAFAVKKYGYANEVEPITTESAAKAYKDIVENAAVEIVCAGSSDFKEVKEIFAQIFAAENHNRIAFKKTDAPKQKNNAVEISEEMDVNQGKLVLGLRLPKPSSKRENDAVRVMSAMLGGTTFSKLFLNVREKLSLCYYCAARYDKLSSSVIIDSGIEFENKQKAQDAILQQIEDIKNGEFTDEELTQTVMFIKNAMSGVTDSPSSVSNWYLTQILNDADNIGSPEQHSADLALITADEVKKAASMLSLDTVYFLKGRD